MLFVNRSAGQILNPGRTSSPESRASLQSSRTLSGHPLRNVIGLGGNSPTIMGRVQASFPQWAGQPRQKQCDHGDD